MKHSFRNISLLLFLGILFSSCAPTPRPGEKFRENATGRDVTVGIVDTPDKIHQYIAGEKNRLTYPGRVPNFQVQTPTGSPAEDDTCVLYTVVTPNVDPSRQPTIDYFIYTARTFTKAFTKVE